MLKICGELGVEAILPEREVEKYPEAGRSGLATIFANDLAGAQVDFGLALGGDGTILRAFNRFPDLNTPILGINFGRIGFLSAIGPDDISTKLKVILEGDYELIDLSLLEFTHGKHRHLAVNDVVVHKQDGGSVIHLSYAVNGTLMDSLRCDGLVVSTPAGSTAYNLSAGGPLVSLGLEAFTVIAIAPHSLRSRALVLGPGETVAVTNESIGAIASIYVDGRQEAGLEPGGSISVSLSSRKGRLVQATGAEFHEKLRDKFIQPPTDPSLRSG